MGKFIKLQLANGRNYSLDIHHIVSFRLISQNPLALIRTCIINRFGGKIYVKQTPAMIMLMLNHARYSGVSNY
ncbi:hypothetical protein DBR32_06405 [Taibaiella sp. KBW10]|uniref:hypothetical protein n=1 Tax=Taibaiella sp. KBW10 TaxID=2153357 RepID=UPI000F59D6C9|nr:hypothetical protein [Taibaiella sp. KBW10]RQO31585.1 hypothetical protein DBR32_06405 [Taibaiella sp. KBW10]